MTRQFYTGSGLRRVKPYVQFFGLYCWQGHDGTWLASMRRWRWFVSCPLVLALLILGDGQGRWTGVWVGYNRETVRDGYPWVPTDQAHARPRQVGPAYQKTRRHVSGPN
jgi:hypothetical protein